MLTSIHPLGERARSQRYAVTLASYVVGAGLGGASFGFALSGLGSLVVPERSWWAIAGATAALLIAAAVDARGSVPSFRRQVNEDWLHSYRGWVYGFGFGFQLGLGLVTIVTSATTYALAVLLVAFAQPTVGAALGMAFGLARCTPVLLASRIQHPVKLAALHKRLDLAARPARRLVAASAALLGVALLVAGP